MLNVSNVKEGMRIEYIGDSLSYGGKYRVCLAEETYNDPNKCPEYEKGKLIIVEFTNNDMPMFLLIDEDLKLEDWKVIES
jgi:hypothetical protein